MVTSIPKQLPADDRRVEEIQFAKWSAAMTVGFTDLQHRARLEGIFFKKRASHS